MSDKFTVVKRGYEMAEVDEYIATLEQVVKSYKEKDAAIKNALISAELAADNIVLNAKQRSYEMKEKSVKQIQDIMQSVGKQRELMNAFQAEYEAQIQKYLHNVVAGDLQAIHDKINALEAYLNRYAEEDDTAR